MRVFEKVALSDKTLLSYIGKADPNMLRLAKMRSGTGFNLQTYASLAEKIRRTGKIMKANRLQGMK